jgi:hypothetical protein
MAMMEGALFAVDGCTVEDVFTDAAAAWAAPFWRQILHGAVPTSGYTITAAGYTLLYSIARPGSAMTLFVPDSLGSTDLVVYDVRGRVQRIIHLADRHGRVRVFIARRTYALLQPNPVPGGG